MSELHLDSGDPASGQKVMLATPVYEKPAACYTFSIASSREALHRAGIQTAYLLLSGNCHVDDARNRIVQEFLLSDCTDLVFLDADVSWEKEQLVQLCQFDEDLVGGVYPYRRDDERAMAKMPALLIEGETSDDRGLMRVAGLPTGFMRIRRRVLDELAKDADQYALSADRRSKVPVVFERTFNNGTRLGGDLNFCRKWAEKGGAVLAAIYLRLGHSGGAMMHDSLAAYIRRTNEDTLAYMVRQIRRHEFCPDAIAEARKLTGNSSYAAPQEVLSICAALSRKAEGPILETGSGLSSIVLAAGTDEPVYCLEHSEKWAAYLQDMVTRSGVENVRVVMCGIADGWYDVPGSIPKEFALVLNDGPPRQIGSRMGLFDRYGSTPTIICDDADDRLYGDQLAGWCQLNSRRIDFLDRAAIIRE